MPLLAMIFLAAETNYQSPLFWAVMVGWILSVTLHEFAHGLVGYLGGDHTVRERGGLTLNPLQYADPMMTFILPVIFLLAGGIPLPGGSTMVRRDLLRSRWWGSAVSAAGPAMNFLLFLLCLIPLHPKLGWVDTSVPVGDWSNAQIFLGATAVLQFIAVILNLIPVPPLDGFGIVAPFLPADLRRTLITPPTSTILFLGYFLVLWETTLVWRLLAATLFPFVHAVGFSNPRVIYHAFVIALYGQG